MVQGTLAAYGGWGLRPVDLGFDQSWSGEHFLLLRQGETIPGCKISKCFFLYDIFLERS